MISVLTLTYKRHHLLEEAIESFLRQNVDAEMVIINDNPEVDYVFDHPNVRIINHKERFNSISDKLQFGYKQCKYDWIYRLDDDDLLGPKGLVIARDAVFYLSPGYDIIRSSSHHFFNDNVYQGLAGSVNNGNIYSRQYLNRISWPGNSCGEDMYITFGHNANILTIDEPTMIYRWGMSTLHISGMGRVSNEEVMSRANEVLDNTIGTIYLTPQFNKEYYGQIT